RRDSAPDNGRADRRVFRRRRARPFRFPTSRGRRERGVFSDRREAWWLGWGRPLGRPEGGAFAGKRRRAQRSRPTLLFGLRFFRRGLHGGLRLGRGLGGLFALQGGGDEGGEKRMRLEGLGL